MNQKESKKVITIPFLEYLDSILRQDSVAQVPLQTAELIFMLDEHENHVHVELPDYTSKEEQPTIIRIWRIKEWKTYYNKILADQTKSEEERQKTFRRNEALLELAKKIELECNFNRQEAKDLAVRLFNEQQIGTAKLFGIDLTEFINKHRPLTILGGI